MKGVATSVGTCFFHCCPAVNGILNQTDDQFDAKVFDKGITKVDCFWKVVQYQHVRMEMESWQERRLLEPSVPSRLSLFRQKSKPGRSN